MNIKPKNNPGSWKEETLGLLSEEKVRLDLNLTREKTGIELSSKERKEKVEFIPETDDETWTVRNGEIRETFEKKDLIDEAWKFMEEKNGKGMDPKGWPSENEGLTVILLKLRSILSKSLLTKGA